MASLRMRLSRRNRPALRRAPFTQDGRQRSQFRRTATGTTAKSSSARRVVASGGRQRACIAAELAAVRQWYYVERDRLMVFDPNDPNGKTLYAGTGEPNGSSDSEAGVGIYKSTDGGKSWSVVAGSTSVSTGRSVGAVAIDPANANHIFIGTDVARHGSSSVNGGRFTPRRRLRWAL